MELTPLKDGLERFVRDPQLGRAREALDDDSVEFLRDLAEEGELSGSHSRSEKEEGNRRRVRSSGFVSTSASSPLECNGGGAKENVVLQKSSTSSTSAK